MDTVKFAQVDTVEFAKVDTVEFFLNFFRRKNKKDTVEFAKVDTVEFHPQKKNKLLSDREINLALYLPFSDHDDASK